jgi:hypothetical protein
MRGWAALLTAGVVLATGSPASGQIGLFLASGTGIEPDTTAAYWVSAHPDVRAVAVADIVLLSQNPLNAPLAMLAAAGQTRELSAGLQSPPVGFPFNPAGGATIYGGTPPPGKLGGPPGGSGGGGGGQGGGGSGGGGSGMTPVSDGSPLVTLAIAPPTDTTPGSVSVSATDPTGFPLGTGVTVPIPVGGWWTLGTTPDTSIPGSPGGGGGNTGGGPLVPDPGPKTPDPDPVPPGGGGTPVPAGTPEPATAVLAMIGATVAGACRLRRRENRN